jgi:hypothetical protein
MKRNTVEVTLPERLMNRLALASTAVDLSASEYVRAATWAALMTQAENDERLAAAFRYLDTFR